MKPTPASAATIRPTVSEHERLTDTYRSCRLTDVATSVDAVLDALGDRTRRSILEKLVVGPVAVGVLADQLPVSRPAVSQHLRVLKDAGLVVESVAGTRRLYRINRSGLMIVRDYLDRFWETTLDNFAILAAAEAEAESRKNPPGKTHRKRPDPGRSDSK
jgi:DNA-binding transcriptional ArsR family regulator